MAGSEDDVLTRLTIDLSTSAAEALDLAAAITGDNRTDTAGRALLIYALMVEQAAQGRGRISFDLADEGPRVLVEVNPQRWRFW